MDELEKYMRALVLLQIEAAEEEGDQTSPAVLLSRAGFTNPEIARLLNKTPGAVKQEVHRAKTKSRTKR